MLDLCIVLGLYIHIPFCRQACHYCNFHFSTQLQHIDVLTDAICSEMELVLQSSFLQPDARHLKPQIGSIYFGGGSPSVLNPQQLQRIFDAIHRNFNCQCVQEITFEANPEDIHHENLSAWKSFGINRLSIGIQSLCNNELKWMNRAHTAEHSKLAVEQALQSGFSDLSIDLIYGSEKKTLQQWQIELDWAADCGVNHLSCYALTIEEKTPFHIWAKQGKINTLTDEHAEAQFQYLTQWAAIQNWEHYEISNLCKPKHRAMHNSNYWSGQHYLGLGPSAHSFNGISRRWNVANNQHYLQGILSKSSQFEEELLSKSDRFNEYLMTQLRIIDGVSITQLELLWPGFNQQKATTIAELILQNKLTFNNNHLCIPPNARFLSDGITIELMVDPVNEV